MLNPTPNFSIFHHIWSSWHPNWRSLECSPGWCLDRHSLGTDERNVTVKPMGWHGSKHYKPLFLRMEKNISARKSSKTRPNQLKQRKITDLDKKLALKESKTYPVLPKSLHHNLGISPLKEKAPFFLASIESSSSNRLAWQQTETSLHPLEDLYSFSVSCVHALPKTTWYISEAVWIKHASAKAVRPASHVLVAIEKKHIFIII